MRRGRDKRERETERAVREAAGRERRERRSLAVGTKGASETRGERVEERQRTRM